MFTIKWIGPNGAQMLYTGCGISYTPGEKPTVSFEIEGSGHCVIDVGTVYVMNGQGRTVANYILSNDEFPHGLAPRG